MAKKLTFTADEVAKAIGLIDKGLIGNAAFRKRWQGLSDAEKSRAARKVLGKHAKRNADGSIDWNAFFAALMKYLPMLIALLFPK